MLLVHPQFETLNVKADIQRICCQYLSGLSPAIRLARMTRRVSSHSSRYRRLRHNRNYNIPDYNSRPHNPRRYHLCDSSWSRSLCYSSRCSAVTAALHTDCPNSFRRKQGCSGRSGCRNGYPDASCSDCSFWLWMTAWVKWVLLWLPLS